MQIHPIIIDHGILLGLLDDDHTQYALLAGRSSGQVLIGGTASGESLTLQSTAHATRGKIIFGAASAYDEVNDRFGLGETTPTSKFHIEDTFSTDGGSYDSFTHNFTSNADYLNADSDTVRGINITLTSTGDVKNSATADLGEYALFSTVNSDRTLGAVGQIGILTTSGIFAESKYTGDVVNGSALIIGVSGKAGVATGFSVAAGQEAELFGGRFIVTGNLGTTGTTKKYGVFVNVESTADNSYGLFLAQVAGATNNYGIWDDTGQDWVLDADNQKIRLGETQGDFDLYSDGTHGILQSNGEIRIYAGGDTDDYLSIATVADQTTLNFVGQNGRITASGGTIDFDNEHLETSGNFISTGGGETGKFLTGSAGVTVFAFSGASFDIRAGSGGSASQNVLRVTSAGNFDFKTGNLLIRGEINFRDTDISIGSTLTDGILDISADFAIDMFFDNADVGDEADGQSLNINRRAAEGDDYISLYVDKDRKGLIGFSGDNDLIQLAANAVTINGDLALTGDITQVNSIFMNSSLVHFGDEDTSFGFGDDSFVFQAGGVIFSRFSFGKFPFVVFNEDLADIDFTISTTGVVNFFFLDAENDVLYLGDGGVTNYSKFEADGTLEFNGAATVFEDIDIDLSAAKVPASNAPTWTAFIGNLKAYTYDVNDFQEFSSEIAHSYKQGSTIEFHVHGATNGLEGSDKTIKFEIEYELVNNQTSGAFGDVFAGTTTISGEITISASTTDKTSWVIDIGDDVSGNFLQGATLVGRIRRIASTGAEPASDPFVVQVGVHIEQDTVGSRTQLTK